MSNTSHISSYLSRIMNMDAAEEVKKKVRVRIAGENFTLIAAEPEEYIHRVAMYVDSKIAEVTTDSRIPRVDAVILAACNITDESLKATDTAEKLRVQLKAYLDEIAHLREDLSDARAEISQLHETVARLNERHGTADDDETAAPRSGKGRTKK